MDINQIKKKIKKGLKTPLTEKQPESSRLGRETDMSQQPKKLASSALKNIHEKEEVRAAATPLSQQPGRISQTKRVALVHKDKDMVTEIDKDS